MPDTALWADAGAGGLSAKTVVRLPQGGEVYRYERHEH